MPCAKLDELSPINSVYLDCCPLCVVFLHSMEVQDYFCAVFCKSSIKPFIKLSRTALLLVDPITPVSFTIIITGLVVAHSVGTKAEKRRVLSGKCCGTRGGCQNNFRALLRSWPSNEPIQGWILLLPIMYPNQNHGWGPMPTWDLDIKISNYMLNSIKHHSWQLVS